MPRGRLLVLLLAATLIGLLISRSLSRDLPSPEPDALVITVSIDGARNVTGEAGTPLHQSLLKLATKLSAGELRSDQQGVRIIGVTTKSTDWPGALEIFRGQYGQTLEIHARVEVIDASIDVNALCARMFRVVATEPQIRFQESGIELSPASFAALDRIIEFARDCPAFGLTIAGHSDGTGHEPSNLALSQRRAEIVADYISEGGIERLRLEAVGKGSSERIADDSTILGRQLNRRIEFSLMPLPLAGSQAH